MLKYIFIQTYMKLTIYFVYIYNRKYYLEYI